jgi:hypothetical protein
MAPMGVHVRGDKFVILPFRPCNTLNNILETNSAVINYCDDVRIFAGCLTGRRNWPLKKAEKVNGQYLEAALAHCELEIDHIEDDDVRPMIFCKALHTVNHKPFTGFNRAQFSVIEASILISRLHMLSWEKVESELEYLHIGLKKTAGDNEMEAWHWLMEVIEDYKHEVIQA